jgi:hypothetical protein
MTHDVFITGGTGYMGRALIPALRQRGHTVHALVRPGSERKLAAGAIAVRGDALDAKSYAEAVAPADTFVHLVGTPHPGPAKARQFREVDLVSIRAARAHRTLRVPQCRSARAGHGGIHRRAQRRRNDAPREWNPVHFRAAVVRPRARPPMAPRGAARVLAHGASAFHARDGNTPRARYAGRARRDTRAGSRKSAPGDADHRRAANTRTPRVRLIKSARRRKSTSFALRKREVEQGDSRRERESRMTGRRSQLLRREPFATVRAVSGGRSNLTPQHVSGAPGAITECPREGRRCQASHRCCSGLSTSRSSRSNTA